MNEMALERQRGRAIGERLAANHAGAIPRAFTLIEMLVATALTLMLVAALAQAFSIVGTGVSTNRAALEMVGQLRSVSLRLQDDLSGVTVPTLPWPDPSSGLGYFEYLDGADHDGTRYAWTIPNTSFGDADDILMFTARNDQEHFLGSRSTAAGGVTTIESPFAEIVWFTTLTDVNGNGTLEPYELEDYTLYRRALLIRPDLWLDVNGNGTQDPNESGIVAILPSSSSTYNITSQTDLRNLYNDLRLFFSRNDISVRIVTQLSGASGTDLQVTLVANSLGDLTMRENRFAHRRIVGENPASPPDLRYFPASFPHAIDRDVTSATSLPLIRQPFPNNPLYLEPGAIKTGDYQGEDVMLPHTLAFDIRAFDPLAMVAAHPGEDGAWGVIGLDDDNDGTSDNGTEAGWGGSDDEPMIPGDVGFGVTASGNVQITSGGSNRSVRQIGQGAFVDLSYAGKTHWDGSTTFTYNLLANSSNAGWSYFSGRYPVCYRSNPADDVYLGAAGSGTYDTWSFHYEYDGIDQDNDGTTDQATDGLDSSVIDATSTSNPRAVVTTNGVDDVGERETSPPYPVPLRAIQVRVRMIDQSSRQVRQVTVESSFINN